MAKDRKDDSQLHLKVGERKILTPSCDESRRCEQDPNTTVCEALQQDELRVEQVHSVQDVCPTWKKFLSHRERQGVILPCVSLCGQLMNKSTK